ncbi:MAG: UDP-glucose 4-epimerase GalE [Thermodesulfobacteriota bacterium]|nr:UDP-glucose 4-epimerase GalE [Thermodesulfobacteriota bacterium]
MTQEHILVTGGAGYIGSHTVVELLNNGYEAIVVDDLSNSEVHVMEGIEKITGKRPIFEKLDLKNRQALSAFFQNHANIKAVIHFAAFKSVRESVDNPLKYYRNNVLSLINLLEEMVINRISHLVFSSSCTVYGQPDELPVTEKSPFKSNTSPYGKTKQISESIIRDVVQATPSLQALSLRYFNPIGAHETSFIGELPLGLPNNLVPSITQTAVGVRHCFDVYGDDYDTPDGTCIRDYLHVVDLANAHLRAIHRLVTGENQAGFEVFNLGTGKGYSVREVIRLFEKVSGIALNYRIKKQRPGDAEQIWSDTSFANQVLGWKAKRSLEEMLRSAWRWEQNYRNR